MTQPEESRDFQHVSQGYPAGVVAGDPVSVPGELRAPEEGRRTGLDPDVRDAQGRVVGSPLPTGTPLPGSGAMGVGPDGQRLGNPPGRALTVSSGSGEDPTTMARAMNMLKQAAPIVAKLLPLLDGSLGMALSNLFAPRQQAPPPPPPVPIPMTVDLAPVHTQLSDLQTQQNDLRATVQEQTAGIKRVEDQLELVREATDRNTLEQKELIEDLKTMGRKVNLFAVMLSLLLLGSIVLNVFLYMHIRRVLP